MRRDRLRRASGAVFAEFAARPPWWGGDLQTVHNRVLRTLSDRFANRLVAAEGERLGFSLADGSGDTLLGLLNRPAREAGRPLVVLVHGLTGAEDSLYMKASAAYFLSQGYPALRLNLRGAGPSRPFCRFSYHAGGSEDLREALRQLVARGLAANGILLVGYSLGANMLLKFLGEAVPDAPVLAAASVSAPIDLAATSRRMLEARNRLYHLFLLAELKKEILGAGAVASEAERAAILASRTIYEFDDRFQGPRNGFAGADDYYARCAALRFLPGIRTPTLLIHALDDPWIPSEMYLAVDWEAYPDLIVLLPAGGGHVGFHAKDDPVPWSDRRIGEFFGRFSPGGG